MSSFSFFERKKPMGPTGFVPRPPAWESGVYHTGHLGRYIFKFNSDT
jgi:hypothetical protein